MRRLILLLTLPLLAACDGSIEDDFVEEVVVESYQLVGSDLSSVFVFQTAQIGEAFDRSRLSIVDADVRVLLLGADGSVEQTFAFEPNRSNLGEYRASGGPAHEVLPLRRYRLEVDAPGKSLISSETVTPGAFTLTNASSNEATWGADEITFTVSRPEYPTRQAVFLFTTETQRAQLSTEVATPFYRAIFESQDDDEADPFSPEDVRIGSSPLLNEEGYRANADGTLRVDLPWIAVPFYGPNKVSASAVDDNLFDFLRSQAVQQGGSTLSPGEIPNVLDRVENGVGVFGSYSRVTTDVFVRCEAARNFGNACPSDS